MEFFVNGKRYTAVNNDGSFIEAKEFNNVMTISIGVNKIIVDDAKCNDTAIDKQSFFNALYNALDYLNHSVIKLEE